MTPTTSAHSLRLTRRGRALLVLLLAGLLLAAFSLGSQASQASDVVAGGVDDRFEQTTVQPGESLWSVAQRIAPDHDPREVVTQIRRLNDLSSSQLQVGQHLLLPTAG
ncbi:MAG: LysM peptidoglycan-binding domain-containing protein [Mycobacteriales bacterium]